jgi:MFS family permease
MDTPSSTKSTSLGRGVLGTLLLLALAGNLAWAVENQYFNTFLYDHITPDPQAVSLMVAITAVVSTVTAITMGTLSDRTRSKWGKRRPYIVVGYIFWGVLTAAFPMAALFQPVALGVFMAILFDSFMSFFGATASDAALNAYVADVTNTQNRGRVIGSMQIMTWVSYLIVYGGAGYIIQAFGYQTFFYVLGGLVTLIGIFVAPRLKETPSTEQPEMGFWAQIASTFRLKALLEQRNLFLLLISLTLFMVAFNVFFPFLLIYMKHFLKLSILNSSIALAVTILVGGILMAYPIGLLVDRVGRRPVALAAVVCESVGLFLFSQARSLPIIILCSLLWLIPYTAWTISTQTWTKDLFPEDKRGQFAGYYIFFNVALTMIPGPLLGGWLANTYGIPTIIDGKAGVIPTPIVFQVAAVMVLLTLIPLLAIKKK